MGHSDTDSAPELLLTIRYFGDRPLGRGQYRLAAIIENFSLRRTLNYTP
jgi:hypothetical protein